MWRWTNIQEVDCEGPCSWLGEEWRKDVSRKGTSDLCPDDSITVGNYVPDAVLSVLICALTEFALDEGGTVYFHFTDKEIEA